MSETFIAALNVKMVIIVICGMDIKVSKSVSHSLYQSICTFPNCKLIYLDNAFCLIKSLHVDILYLSRY